MVSNTGLFDSIDPIPGRYPVEFLDTREARLRDRQFVEAGGTDEFCPLPKPAAWEALEAAREAEDANRAAADAWAEARSAQRELAGGIVAELGYEPCEDFRVEIEPEAPYEPAVWLHGDYGKIRVPLEGSSLSELARVATFLPDVPYWAAPTSEDSVAKPAFAWDIVVPYAKARGEEATHILLYDAATSRCIGHVPPRLACGEAIEAAQRMWDEIEASWRMVTPAFPRSPWSADSAETPDTPESAGSAE